MIKINNNPKSLIIKTALVLILCLVFASSAKLNLSKKQKLKLCREKQKSLNAAMDIYNSLKKLRELKTVVILV